MADSAKVPPEVIAIEEEIQQIFKALNDGFQKLDKIKDGEKQRKQLEELTGKMRDIKRIVKDFDQAIKGEEAKCSPEVVKMVADKKKGFIRELNTYIALRKTFMSTIGKKDDLLAGASQAPTTALTERPRVASTYSNVELLQVGRKQMDDTSKSIERSKRTYRIFVQNQMAPSHLRKVTSGRSRVTAENDESQSDSSFSAVVEDTLHIGTETAVTLKGQTEQLGRIVSELDTIQFSIKKATQMVRQIGKQMATDKCIMGFLFLVVGGVIAVIVVKVIQGRSKSSTSPSTGPIAAPTSSRRLLSIFLDMN